MNLRDIKARSRGVARVAPSVPCESLLAGRESSVVEPAHEPAREVVYADIELLRPGHREPQRHIGVGWIGRGAGLPRKHARPRVVHAENARRNAREPGARKPE